MTVLNFNAAAVPLDDFAPIPVGEYLACCVSEERKPNSAGTGEYLELVFEILEGEHKGRQIREWLNLWHPADRTVAIANQTLAKICRAIGLDYVSDAKQLLKVPMIVKTKLVESKDPRYAGTHRAAIANWRCRTTATSGEKPPWD